MDLETGKCFVIYLLEASAYCWTLSVLLSVCKQCENFFGFSSEASTVWITKSPNVQKTLSLPPWDESSAFAFMSRARIGCVRPVNQDLLNPQAPPLLFSARCSTRTVNSPRNFAQSLDFTSLLEYENLLFWCLTLLDRPRMRWRFRRADCRCKE